LDVRGGIPTVVIITPGNVHDVNILDDLLFEAGAIYVMDRGYMDFARLYPARWRVELFFKWIKQHLRIKAFYGTTENAVKTQVWIAISKMKTLTS
jgi:IS4 transposase